MRASFFILCFAFSCPLAAENFVGSDLVGRWIQEVEISKNEKMSLRIEQDLKSHFFRDLEEYPDQSFQTDAVSIDDIWIFDFNSSGDYGYKLVLSGWRQNNTTTLFGTMFMYRKGEIFNGVEVSFRKDS